MQEHYLELYADHLGDTIIYKLDPRVKLICAITAIIAVLFTPHWQIAMLFLASTLIAVAIYKIPLRLFMRRMLYPTYIIAVISAIQPFTYGATLIYKTPLFSLPIYLEGLHFSFLIFTRCMAAIAVLNLLVITTPVMDIMRALAWFRVPSVLLDTALLMFRYIFVLSDEAERIHRAQEARCGYSQKLSYLRRLRNFGTLFGVLLVRSYERAVKVGNAMISRGYKGERLFVLKEADIPLRHVLYGVVIFTAIILLILIEWILL
ncbi:MAG: cobalt ECF transporter T component CbiQ [Candidatus Bathyarchaeia archaeon]